MFPILVTMYVLLANREECEAELAFSEAYLRYAANTPALFPRLGLAPVDPHPHGS
jgi:protein-S-isoprenylcysteine O-methyltransferase Ste14